MHTMAAGKRFNITRRSEHPSTNAGINGEGILTHCADLFMICITGYGVLPHFIRLPANPLLFRLDGVINPLAGGAASSAEPIPRRVGSVASCAYQPLPDLCGAHAELNGDDLARVGGPFISRWNSLLFTIGVVIRWQRADHLTHFITHPGNPVTTMIFLIPYVGLPLILAISESPWKEDLPGRGCDRHASIIRL